MPEPAAYSDAERDAQWQVHEWLGLGGRTRLVYRRWPWARPIAWLLCWQVGNTVGQLLSGGLNGYDVWLLYYDLSIFVPLALCAAVLACGSVSADSRGLRQSRWFTRRAVPWSGLRGVLASQNHYVLSTTSGAIRLRRGRQGSERIGFTALRVWERLHDGEPVPEERPDEHAARLFRTMVPATAKMVRRSSPLPAATDGETISREQIGWWLAVGTTGVVVSREPRWRSPRVLATADGLTVRTGRRETSWAWSELIQAVEGSSGYRLDFADGMVWLSREATFAERIYGAAWLVADARSKGYIVAGVTPPPEAALSRVTGYETPTPAERGISLSAGEE